MNRMNKDELSAYHVNASNLPGNTKHKKRINAVLSADTKILIVEENLIFRIWLTGVLVTLGFHALTSVTNKVKAFDMIENAIEENKPFDIVIAELVVLEGGLFAGMPFFEAINKLEKPEKPFVVATIGLYANLDLGPLKNFGISHCIKRDFCKYDLEELFHEPLRS